MTDAKTFAKALPADLLAGHHAWKKDGYAAQQDRFTDLAENGQKPVAMVISCCDSRVQSTEIFGVPAGTFFLHRNIANLVPPYAPGSDFHGTASALEYAVKALAVPHLIIVGHSQCGGVQACYDMCENGVAAEASGFEFVGHWLEVLRPAHRRVTASAAADRVVDMGHQGVVQSLENLAAYPFIAEAMQAGKLSLHGAWHDIGSGTLFVFNADSGTFEPQ